MGKIIENAIWQNDVYLIEKSDKVLGGEDGKINLQAKNLADRTAYLKEQVEAKANKNDVTTGLSSKANASHTHTMANITDLAAAMNAKANLANPTFTGTPKAPTPAQTTNDTTIATTAFVKTAIAVLVGSAPATLDTLAEIATALANDGNLKQTLLTEIGKKANASHTHTMANITDLAAAMNAKANLASPTFTGTPKAPTPAQTVNDTTIATTAFVKSAIAALVGSAPATLDTLAEIATALGSDGNLKNTLLTEIGKKANQTDFTTLKNLLIGIPFPYPLTAVPSGCLAFNGQAFNKTTYPILAQKYPSGVLPDLRGEFIRGWDNGRRVDAERALLSPQNFAMQKITAAFSIRAVQEQDGERRRDLVVQTTGAFRNEQGGTWDFGSLASPSGRGSNVSVVNFDSERVVSSANETRPRNIAFQYICLAA